MEDIKYVEIMAYKNKSYLIKFQVIGKYPIKNDDDIQKVLFAAVDFINSDRKVNTDILKSNDEKDTFYDKFKKRSLISITFNTQIYVEEDDETRYYFEFK